MKTYYVSIKAVDAKGVTKEITYERLRAGDVGFALDIARQSSGIPLSEITHVYITEKVE